MQILKVKIRQQSSGKPGFAAIEEFYIYINTDNMTMFNESLESKNETIVRMTCGTTICVAMSCDEFEKLLNGEIIEQKKSKRSRCRGAILRPSSQCSK